MIFVSSDLMSMDLDAHDPHPIDRVRVGGVPEFPVHHTLNLRERSLKVFLPEFVEWLIHNGIEMVEFFNHHPSFHQKIVAMFEAGAMDTMEVVAWIESSERDTATPSDVSYGFRSQSDYVAFKMRWL